MVATKYRSFSFLQKLGLREEKAKLIIDNYVGRWHLFLVAVSAILAVAIIKLTRDIQDHCPSQHIAWGLYA